MPTCALDSFRPRLAELNEHFARHPLQCGMATTVAYTNDESPELVRHEGMDLFRYYLNSCFDGTSKTPYSQPGDWVFCSFRLNGTQPRVANMRPAAVRAGILSSYPDEEGRLVDDDPRRFGFHNLRHSLASFSSASRPNGEVQASDFTRPANRLGAISM